MDDITFFWSGLEPIWRIIVVGTLGYTALVIILKTSGKRTLAKMNMFDFIITVTIGSAFGRVLTAKNVGITEAIVAFILLAILQMISAFLETKYKWFKRIGTTDPALLYYKGEYQEKNLKKAKLDKDEIFGAVREKGFGSLEEVEAIIFESNASFSIISKSKNGDRSAYKDILERTEDS